MVKKVVTFLTCLATVFGGLQISPALEEVSAAQFTGSHFAMEFSGYDSANMEKANGWSNGGMFNCTWLDSNVNFSNDGIMSLTINSNGAGGYTGGEYRTRQAFGYGMYQVSMKPIKNPGVVTSFFTYTGPTDGTIWDEIDIEFLGYDTTKVQFNYFTNGVGGHEYLYDLGFDASQAFHTYGFYWGEGTITWYVDGNPVYTVNSSDVPVTPGKIMMNAWPGIGVDDWLQPYNGVTPLTGYYDWAVYDAPGTGTETTTAAEQPTDAPVTAKAPVGLTYAGNETLPYYFAWQAVEGAEYYNLYVNGELSATGITSAGYNVDASEFVAAGEYTIGVTAIVGGVESEMAVTNMTVTSGTQPTTTAVETTTVKEQPTEELTTAASSEIIISDDVNVEGYQISSAKEGSRVIGSVEPTINGLDVENWGFIYAIEQAGEDVFSVPDDEMYVGTDNKYITSLESTPIGTSDTIFGDSATATYFVRTTLFGVKSVKEFTAKYKVRAYAVLSNGSYVYSDVYSYSVFDISDMLYQNKMMNTNETHQYLYNSILTVVDPAYKEVDYNWSNIVIK